MGAVRKALNRAWGVEDPRPLAQAKAIDLLLVLLIGAIVAVSFALTADRDAVGAARAVARARRLVGRAPGPHAGPIVPALVAFVALAVLFSTVPAKETRLRDTWPGAATAALAFEAAKTGFAFYLANFASYAAVYASLAAVVAFLVFVFLSANVVLFGAEVAIAGPAWIGFAVALTAVGLLLIGAAMASGLVQRTVLSISVLSVAAGAALDLAGVLAVDPGASSLVLVVELVLLITLFSGGLLVEREFLREHWRAPVRALAVAMPLNAVLLAGAAKALFGELSWVEAFLVGCVLSPTDPVITSSVVTSATSPSASASATTSNLESGLNDGLALPFVLLVLELSTGEAGSVLEATGSLGLETVLGLAAGVVLALAAGGLLGRLPDWALERRFEGLYALGLGLLAFGGADLVGGNGLIAAFCAGVALAVTRAVRAQLDCARRLARVRPRRLHDPRLDRGPRSDRHGGGPLGRATDAARMTVPRRPRLTRQLSGRVPDCPLTGTDAPGHRDRGPSSDCDRGWCSEERVASLPPVNFLAQLSVARTRSSAPCSG